MKKSTLLLLLLCWLSGMSTQVYAQIEQDKRIEFELESAWGSNYEIQTIEKHGLIISKPLHEETKADEKKWLLRHYDTELVKKWETTVPVDEDLYLAFTWYDKYASEPTMYLIFQNSRKETMEIVTINVLKQTVGRQTVTIPKRTVFEQIAFYDDMLHFYGTVKNKQVILGQYDLLTKKINYTTLHKKESITNMAINHKEGFVDIATMIADKKTQSIFVHSYSRNVKIRSLEIHANDPEKRLWDARVDRLEGDHFVLGNFSSSKRSSAEGFYISKFQHAKQVYCKYYRFTDFKNFFTYLSDRKQEKIEKKIEKAKKHGKEYDVRYSMELHNIIKQDDQLILIGEAYYPVYRTETRTSYVNGKPVTTTYQRFDGYVYSHAVVAGFDTDGKLLWDQCFEMGDVKSYSVRTFLHQQITKDVIRLTYAYGTSIITKVIKGNQVLDDKERTRVLKQYDSDNVRYSSSGIQYWYDDYFLDWGTQKIKNKELSKQRRKKNNKDNEDTDDELDENDAIQKKRRVFYLNRIKYTG